MNKLMQSSRFLVSGRVQGVGFRYFVSREASRIGVRGYVKNLSDGRVECVAQGTIEQLENLEIRLKKGPPMSKVLEIRQESDLNIQEYHDFQILR